MINDYGQNYRPVGAPGSLERVRVEKPRLIDKYRSRYFSIDDYNDCYAHDDLKRQDGISSKLERESIITAAKQPIQEPNP